MDGSNLFHACNARNFKVDLIKLVNVLVGGRLARAYFYTAFNLQKQEQIKFLHAIQMQGLRVKAVSLKKVG
ncbi:MAG: hypothetical protein DRJ56_01290 [Thermoprotei archaeon]|nr:MAG: hypothetical protein DRJ56_01290 [Thermoprotei archaeon]